MTRRSQELNHLVAQAHALIYGRPVKRRQSGFSLWFQVLAIPVAIRRSWHYHGLAALVLGLATLYGYFGAAADPDWALNFTFPGDSRTPYATRSELLESLLQGRQGEIDSGEKTLFAASLWQNNTKVALMAFFLGFLGGIPTALLLLYNGVMLGTYTYTFHSNGLAYEWWAWILPHGFTELGAIVLLAGGGFWIGQAILHPGNRTRVEVLSERRADVIRLLLFAFPALFLAALIESFVRQSGLSDPARYTFAVLSLLPWVAYLGFVRPPTQALEAADAEQTLARRQVALPEDDELIGAFLRNKLRTRR